LKFYYCFSEEAIQLETRVKNILKYKKWKYLKIAEVNAKKMFFFILTMNIEKYLKVADEKEDLDTIELNLRLVYKSRNI
jgi:hypothetical protein